MHTNTRSNGNGDGSRKTMAVLSLAALGVVFGDIGTSPLYAMRECFSGQFGVAATQENVLGVLSLIFWTLAVIVTIKYVTFILQADNEGEGGIMALTALLGSSMKNQRSKFFLISLGLFATCLMYGDGMITPAITVLSAVEGLEIIAPGLESYVVPIAVVILAGLFLIQRRGTTQIGSIFGPIMVIWFTVLAALGVNQIIQYPEVLKALAPWYGLSFLIHSGGMGFMVLGAVFLAVTGAEVLYADLGHFGTRPIRLMWYCIVLPSLILTYFGQGAMLLRHPEVAAQLFYATVPSWGLIPMVALTTLSTIIASQAVITGIFSLTRQAVSLGYLPRMQVIHTSTMFLGQIYTPQMNWLLMLATLGLVINFQSSTNLAAAYGIAVSSVMLISTVLFYYVARLHWHWSKLAAGLPTILFLAVDLSFFSANLSKIMHGAWLPLVIGASIFAIMTTWRRGRKLLNEQLKAMSVPLPDFVQEIQKQQIHRIKGNAIFLSGQPDTVPVALMHNLKHNKGIHDQVAVLHFIRAGVPRVANLDKLRVIELGKGFYQFEMTYGFMEQPNVPLVLTLAGGQGIDFPINQTSFFIGREKVVFGGSRIISRWRAHLFSYLARNAYDASAYYGIPERQVMEVGVQLKF